MHESYSESEALSQVGTKVVTMTKLLDVPAGTKGSVVHAKQSDARGWTVQVRWDLPPKRTTLFAHFGEFSFNIPWLTTRPTAEFSKSEVEQLLRTIETR